MSHFLLLFVPGSIGTELISTVKLAQKLAHNPQEEMDGLLRGLRGEYVPPAPGGDIIRDGAGVLPTGRNIHALDPYRIPSQVHAQANVFFVNVNVSDHHMDSVDCFLASSDSRCLLVCCE